MMQTWEIGKKPNVGPNFGPTEYFSRVLSLLVVRRSSKLWSYVI